MTLRKFFYYLLFYDEDKARRNYMETIQKNQTPSTFDQVLVRDGLEDAWKPDIFLRLNLPSEFKYECTTGCYRYCIPYSEFKSLSGTSLEPFHTFEKGEIAAIECNGKMIPCIYNSFDPAQNLHSVTIGSAAGNVETVYPFDQVFKQAK